VSAVHEREVVNDRRVEQGLKRFCTAAWAYGSHRLQTVAPNGPIQAIGRSDLPAPGRVALQRRDQARDSQMCYTCGGCEPVM